MMIGMKGGGDNKMSSRVDVTKETFEDVTVFGYPMLFTCLRCDRKTLPRGMYMYEIRHDDDGQGIPCEIADSILVNHWGTVISNRPVKMDTPVPGLRRYRLIDEEMDWNYEGTMRTLAEYMAENPPRHETKEYER